MRLLFHLAYLAALATALLNAWLLWSTPGAWTALNLPVSIWIGWELRRAPGDRGALAAGL